MKKQEHHIALIIFITALAIATVSVAQQKEPIRPEQLHKLAEEGKLDELLASAQEILKSGEIWDKWTAYRVLFWGFLTHDRLADLIPVFQKAVQEYSTDPNAYKILGHIYRLQGNITKAIAMYEKVVELSPNDYSAYQRLGAFYLSRGLYERSISAYKKALSVEPSNKELYIWPRADFYKELYIQLAAVYIAIGQQDEAISTYKKALDIWPIDKKLYIQLAAVYNHFGKKEDAQTFAFELKQRAGNNAQMHILLGDFYAAIGQQDEAIKAYEKAVELAPRRRYDILKRAYEQAKQAGKVDLAAQVQKRIEPPPPRPAGTGLIRGTVTESAISSPMCNPVVNARVRYYGPGDQEGEVTTDGAGDFEIVGLRPGTYVLNVSKTGYAMYDELGMVSKGYMRHERRRNQPITVDADVESVVEIKMVKEKKLPGKTRILVLDNTWAGFAILQIRSSGEMSIEGGTMLTLDEWEEFLAINGLRIKTLIIKADKDTKCEVAIGAMRRAKRIEVMTLAKRRRPMLFHISVLREEPTPIIGVKLLLGQVTRWKGRIMMRTPKSERPENKALAYSFPPSKGSIMRIANPEGSERFGTMELNDETVDMTQLPDKFQNVPAGWKSALMIQSEPDVRHEQIYQIVEIAKRSDIDYIGVGSALPRIKKKKTITMTQKVVLRRRPSPRPLLQKKPPKLLSPPKPPPKPLPAAMEQLVGKAAPDFVLNDLSLKQVKLADFKGKVLLLNFFVAQNDDCIKEVPHFIALVKQYHAQDFAMVGISLDDMGAELLTAFVENQNINYPILVGDSTVERSYGIRRMPTTLLLDKEGTVRKQYVGYKEKSAFEADIQTLLGEK